MAIKWRNLDAWTAATIIVESQIETAIVAGLKKSGDAVLNDIRERTPPPAWNPGYPDREPTGALGNAFEATDPTKTNRQFRTTVRLKETAPKRVKQRAFAHEYGMTIRNKNKPYMVFRVKEGHYIKTQKVQMTEKRYFRNSQDNVDVQDVAEALRDVLK